MKRLMKRSFFGGYQRKAVESAVGSLEQQLEESQTLYSRLRKENADFRGRTEELENTCDALKNEVLTKGNEARRLESELEDLKQQYEHSVSIQKEYDRYLKTVGQVYMVACDGADKIVDQAEAGAREMIGNLSDSVETAREHTENAAVSVRAAREKLADALPDLLETINGTFRRIDDFLSMANRVPESYTNELGWQQKTLDRMGRELEEFKRSSQEVIDHSEMSDGGRKDKENDPEFFSDGDFSSQEPFTLSPHSTVPANKHPDLILLKDDTPDPDGSLAEGSESEWKHAVNDLEQALFPEEEKPVLKTEAAKPHLSLLEQEKIRRRQARQNAADDGADEDDRGEPEQNPSVEMPEGAENGPKTAFVSPESAAAPREPATSADSASEPHADMSGAGGRRPNVKELLNKYSQIRS